MSASNWAKCPRCAHHHEQEAERLKRQAEAAYGKVPRADWQALDEKAHTASGPFTDTTLREDYEIFGAETGTVKVAYGASCEVCGLTVSFNHEHALPKEPTMWTPFDGKEPAYSLMFAWELKLKTGEVRYAGPGAAIMWENFGGDSDIEAFRRVEAREVNRGPDDGGQLVVGRKLKLDSAWRLAVGDRIRNINLCTEGTFDAYHFNGDRLIGVEWRQDDGAKKYSPFELLVWLGPPAGAR